MEQALGEERKGRMNLEYLRFEQKSPGACGAPGLVGVIPRKERESGSLI